MTWNKIPEEAIRAAFGASVALLMILMLLPGASAQDYAEVEGVDDEGTAYTLRAQGIWNTHDPAGWHRAFQTVYLVPYPAFGTLRVCDAPSAPTCSGSIDECAIPTTGASPMMCSTSGDTDTAAALGECRYSNARTTAATTHQSVNHYKPHSFNC